MDIETGCIYGLIDSLILLSAWFSKALVDLLLMIIAANLSSGHFIEEGIIFYGLSSDLCGLESCCDFEFSYED